MLERIKPNHWNRFPDVGLLLMLSLDTGILSPQLHVLSGFPR